jgi:ferric-dicitrate binding protein FerR (iron transport regulator)
MRKPAGKKTGTQIAVKTFHQEPKELVQYNTTGKPLIIVLNEGSRVELAPSSQIRYDSSFINNRRDIYLKGTALFRVAKNPLRPFTVYADKIATTALGTVFRVSENNKGHVFVHLFEGRVVVHSDSSMQTTGADETFLRPGELLDFNQQSLSVSVKKSAGQKHAVLKPKAQKKVLHFSNQPLTDMLRVIKEKCSLNVKYADGVIDGMNFTGTWDENKESIIDFLGTVCLLNNLDLINENGVIRITPKKVIEQPVPVD